MLILVVIVAYCIFGIISTILDFTEDYDIELDDLMFIIFVGITIGPVIGLVNIISKPYSKIKNKLPKINRHYVIFKKRNN